MTIALAPTAAPRPPLALVADTPRPRRAAVPFTVRHFRAWAADLILDTGKPWRLEPFQIAFLEDVFRGYPECWLIVPEGNGKTTLLAGLALYHCEFQPFAVVPVAAASREQAEIMYRQAEGFVLRSPALHASVHSAVQAAKGKRKVDVPRFTCLEGYRRINHHAGGRIQVFAADDRTGDGVIPTLGIIDEPHRQRDLSLYRTWSGKLAKRSGQIVAISTAGEPGSDFELTRAKIVDTATERKRRGSFLRAASKRIVMHEWAVPEGAETTDIAAVKSANPFSGITRTMLREKLASPTMTAYHWSRFVCNRPTRDDDAWLGPNGERIWADLADPYEFVEGAPTWVGVDMALQQDTAAVVAIQLRPDGRYHAKCRIWYPEPDRPIDATDVMQHLRELHAAYALMGVSCDPRFFDVPAALLSDEGLPMWIHTQTPVLMTPAVGGLFALIKGGGISHDGDEAFTRQVLAAVPRYSDQGYTLQKSKSRGKIDACIALALAYDRVQRTEAAEETAPMVMFGRAR